MISVAGHGQSLPYACAGSQESYGVSGMPNSVFMWTVDGGVIVGGQGSDSIRVQWNRDRRTHTLSVIEETVHGCFGIPVEATLDINAPVADIGDEEAVCAGDVFDFDATTSYITSLSYLWPDGSTNATYSTGTGGTVWVSVTGTDGCADYDSALLTINPLPAVDLGPDTSLCGTATLLLDAGVFQSYTWSTGDIVNPLSVDGQRRQPEVFWVEVTDENGCQASDTLVMGVCDVYILFAHIPNTITPGNDGKNDSWIIPHIELFPDAELEIFDRWGRLVWRSGDIYNQPWKGETMSGKELPMDAYYYVLDLKVNHVEPLTGYINVIR
jgi:gliding motility-associated-like protein